MSQNIPNGLKEYINSGMYFSDSRKWYNYKYLSAITHKIWAFYVAAALIIMLATISLNINKLLPINQTIGYAIAVEHKNSIHEESAKIIDMDSADGTTPTHFIASNLLKSYVQNRENYDYQNLSKQFLHVRDASTKIVFKRFYSYMSIDNPDSPVLRYQKYAKRQVEVSDIKFISDNNAVVTFMSIARDTNGKIFENLHWQANITYEMGDMKIKLPTGSKFDFLVTDYKLRILEEK